MYFAWICSYYASILFFAFIFLFFSSKNWLIPCIYDACDKITFYVIMKKVELIKQQMVERLILWSIYCVGNLKPLGKQKANTFFRSWFHWPSHNKLWFHNYTFSNITISSHKWLGGPWPTWPTLLSQLCMNCGIIAVVMGMILCKIGKFLSTAQKHNRQNFDLNIPRPTVWYKHRKNLIKI